MKSGIITALLCFVLSGIIAGQSINSNNSNLKNSHSISLTMGVKGNSKASVSGTVPSVDLKSGFTGGLEYGYWFTDEWLAGIKVALVEASADINYSNVKSNSVIAALFGFKYYPESFKLGDAGRLYAGIFIGPVTGFASRVATLPLNTQNVTETVVGGEVLAGADFFVARWLRLGPAVSYNFMGDFSEITGEKKNFSGFGFVFNLGFVL